MKRNNLLVISFLLSSTSIFETHHIDTSNAYYISLSGNDDNPGTIARPFKTLQKINMIELHPGDKIYLKGKEVFTGTLVLNAAGTLNHPILVTSYGNGNAIINSGNSEAIILRGKHVKLKNLNVKGVGRKNGNTTNGISLIAVTDAVVENIKTEGFQKSGI
jgi:hypothetical protein